MSKIYIPKTFSKRNYYECPLCGVNTNLLQKDERIEVNSQTYCQSCYKDGNNRKQIMPRDFYELRRSCDSNDIQQDIRYNINAERACNNLRRIEIAHLHGIKSEIDDMYLDMFYDKENDQIYFRVSLCDDDDPWFGTEEYQYLRHEQVAALLNKNGIHILDGLHAGNWKEYFDFEK